MEMSSQRTPRGQKATPIPNVSPRSPQSHASARSSTRERQGGGTKTCNSSSRRVDDLVGETKTSARSIVGTEAPLSSPKTRRELDSARARSARSISTAGSMSARSSVHSTATPRETARTTSTMAMSTARAEATLVVLEAERAQLERRLKKVEEELELEEALTKKDYRKRGIRAPYGPRR